MAKPLIGIPAFTDNTLPDKMPARFSMSRPFVSALSAVGAVPIVIPVDLDDEQLRTVYERIDGLFLAGGGDMNPLSYGEAVHPKTEGLDPLRDRAELLLARWAIADQMPVLGVCRGIQALNVAAGGTLFQDVGEMIPHAIRHQYFPEKPRDYVAHDIEMLSGTHLSGILGSAARVNSFHHQAVNRVADGFRVAAKAPDGVIEAIEHTDRTFAVGVQWHPESLVTSDRRMKALFEAFVASSH